MTAFGAGGDPVGGDERAVQAHEGQSGGVRAVQNVVELGSVRGDHAERLMQIAVGGGDAEAGLAGESTQVQAVAQPAQHETDLSVHPPSPLRRTESGPPTVPGDPASHRLQHRCGQAKLAR
jgi:hypothetical protein